MAIRPSTFAEYDKASKTPIDERKEWFAAVIYDANTVLYYAFDKAYEVRISDLFDPTGEHEGIMRISIV